MPRRHVCAIQWGLCPDGPAVSGPSTPEPRAEVCLALLVRLIDSAPDRASSP